MTQTGSSSRRSFPILAVVIVLALVGLAARQVMHISGGSATEPRVLNSDVPRGFEAHKGRDGGYVIVAEASGSGDMQQYARTELSALSGFISEMKVTNAVGSDDGHRVMGTVAGQAGGQEVVGLFVAAADSGSHFVLEFDRAEDINSSIGGLHTLANRYLPKQSAVRSSGGIKKVDTSGWNYQTGGDGSVRLLLPPGWQVTGAFKGTVDAVGPNWVVSLGGYVPFSTVHMPFGDSLPVSPMLPPEQGLGKAIEASARMQGKVFSGYRVLDSSRIDNNSAFVYFTGDHGGSPIKGLALAMSAPIPGNQWMLYFSEVVSTPDKFESELPEMMAIWNSWKVDDRVFQERMASAMQSMREINQIISDTAKYREETMEKVNIAFDDYIRDQGRYTGPGGQWTVPNNAVRPFLNACRELGYNCQPVPLGQIQP